MQYVRKPDVNPRVLGIDPGSTSIGFVVTDYDVASGKRIVVYQHTYDLKDMNLKQGDLGNFIHGKDLRIFHICNFFESLIEHLNPDIIVSEDGHLRSMPMAQSFRVLCEVIMALKQTTYRIAPHTEFITVSASKVKTAVNVDGRSDKKDDMLAALRTQKDLLYVDGISIDQFTEHTVDATCVTLWYINILIGAIH